MRAADVIAYINHDLDDAMRAGIVSSDQVPDDVVRVLGATHSQRIDALVKDLIDASSASGGSSIRFSEQLGKAMVALREWLFVHVYRSERVHEDFERAAYIVRELFRYFVQKPNELARFYRGSGQAPGPETATADFIAGMTDRYALSLYRKLFMPRPWKAG